MALCFNKWEFLCQSPARKSKFMDFSVRLGRRKATVAYARPQQWKKEESERLREERDQIRFINLRFERWQAVGLNEYCRGKAMVAYAKPQQRKKEESERLREERDQIKFINLRFERWQAVGLNE